MRIVDSFERSFLFRVTRVVTLVVIGTLLVVFGIVASVGLSTFRSGDGHVSIEEVSKKMSASKTDSPTDSANAPKQADSSVPLPFKVQSYLSSPENRAVLERRLATFDDAGKREYLRNMEEIITAAENRKLDGIEAINAYMELKSSKTSQSEFEKIGTALTRLAVGGALVSVLLLIASFSLVLVLLAIERNTRPAPATISAAKVAEEVLA